MFALNHFAGIVEYSCDGWLDKNLDQPPKETMELMSNSSNETMRLMAEALQIKFSIDLLRSFKIILFILSRFLHCRGFCFFSIVSNTRRTNIC